ncbi:MAG: methionine synthase [Elusimicrobia bacterium]|nr:methionine synthase [Elusimicrobiota bacterium]
MSNIGVTYKNRGREEELRHLLHGRILVVDGAMGTMIQARDLKAEDFGGPALEGCNENLNITRPDVIREIHEAYLEAGADIVETNSFGSTRTVLAEYALADRALEISRAAAQIARQAADKYSTKDKPRFAAGSMGPTTKTILVTGGVTFQQLEAAYAEQALGLLEGGADILLLETAQDTLNLKAGLNGIDQAFQKFDRSVPVMISATIEVMGTMLAGQTAEALYISLEHRNLFSIGLNCATGPDFMTDHIRTLSELSRFGVSAIPNAGLPDENGRYNETPEIFVKKLERFISEGWINIVGGCCGTTPEHIRRVSRLVQGKIPRLLVRRHRCHVSGLEPFEMTDEKRPILVGERTNVIGSRLFKDLVVGAKWEEAAEVGRRQVRNGAHVIDVCLANPDRNELEDIGIFLDYLVKKVKAPIMIDSTDAQVINAALKKIPGKAIINSINLEDGEERFETVVPLIHQYGAAVVVGTIDEDKAQGMAVTAERKLAIARRSFKLLTEKYGLRPEDLIFDPLVFPCATGDKNYFGSAALTIEGVKKIKEALPHCKTILGISNVSFGLPHAGREVLNAVFLHHCVQAGLDLAIVNTEKLARYSSLPEEDKRLAEQLLFWSGPGDPAYPPGTDLIAVFTAHFRDKVAEKKKDTRKDLPVEERLPKNVVEGSKEGLIEDLDTLLKHTKPLAIINGPLMKGMDEVGRLFANNEMIVAEVLQSAEVMKAAVAHLEPFMDKVDVGTKGKIVLATVKGDVHDIGKNLVHIILKNNGYNVVDLGIKVAPEQLIEAVKKEAPRLVGLSGLLVKSAHQMVVTAEDLEAAGIDVPVLVGGAALSAKFTASRIAPRYDSVVVYCKDAMSGLEAANSLVDSGRCEAFVAKNKEIQEYLSCQTANGSHPVKSEAVSAAAIIKHDGLSPAPPDLKLHIENNFDIEAIFRYINPIMLYGKHLGLKGSPENLIKEGNPKAVELHRSIEELKGEILAKNLIKARAVYRFYPCCSEGDSIHILSAPSSDIIETFAFPRQPSAERLCISDFIRPKNLSPDYLCLFVVTCGDGIREESTRLREAGEYLKSHALQAIAIEAAEGFAELLHEKIRAMWGIPDPAGMPIREKFQAKYRGLRVSFGYPACPNLEDQAKLFKLLEPDKHIGVQLTEGFMMEPEASVSALVFHHPQARYFSVGSAVAA